jgi:hypothetical protein
MPPPPQKKKDVLTDIYIYGCNYYTIKSKCARYTPANSLGSKWMGYVINSTEAFLK